MASALRELRKPFALTLPAGGAQSSVLLLRGSMVEFHRPLKCALTAWLAEGNPDDRRAFVWSLMDSAVRGMSIVPREMNPSVLRELVASDPVEWIGALVSYVDRCRLLPAFCLALLNTPADTPVGQRLVRAANTVLTWERALRGDEPSGWRTL